MKEAVEALIRMWMLMKIGAYQTQFTQRTSGDYQDLALMRTRLLLGLGAY